MKFIFILPMPPTQNKQLAMFRGRMIKTREAREYSNKIESFRIRNAKALLGIRKQVQFWINDNKSGLGVDLEFLFDNSSLLCKSKGKQGQYKKIDADNRIKASLDGLSSILGVDDKFFIGGKREKKCLSETSQKLLKVDRIVRVTVYPMSLMEDSCLSSEVVTLSE
jgi:Holliday junction resolvase RusA-like endonuclease